MSANFKINSHNVNGNLYLELIGDFDGSSAWELANTIILKYNKKGLVIINVEKLRNVIPFGSAVFENLMKSRLMPVDKMIFEGAKGEKIKSLRQNPFSNGEKKNNYSNRGRCVTRCSIS